MDRRTFLQTAAASTGSVAVAGCLGDDDEPVSNLGEGPPQYDLPAYSGWPPTESYDGNGVVFMHLVLSRFPVLQQAVDSGQIATDQPLQRVPAYSMETVPNAIETVTSYPFAANIRSAVNKAVQPPDDDGAGFTNETFVERIETPDGNVTTNETATDPQNATSNEPLADSRNATVGETSTDFQNATTNQTVTDSENVTATVGQPAGENRTAGGTNDTVPVSSLGLEVTAVTLIDELLLFQGSFDTAVVSDRYARGFQRVDEQRGVEIYEHDDSGLAFGVSDELLVVPTEIDRRTVDPETRLAHSLSRYINTLDRVVDDEHGRWLFETTGQTALSLGVWGTDDPVGRIADTVGEPPADDTDSVFSSVENMITALEVTVDEAGSITEFEGRFAGLFGESVPTEDELRSTLVGGATSAELFVDESRVHLSTTFEDR